MSLELKIDKGDLNNAIRALKRSGADLEKAVPRIVSDTTTAAYRKAKEIATDEGIKRTGLYQKSMRMRVEGVGVHTEGFVGNAAKDPLTGFPYPQVIEHGSKPHIITPNAKKALRFVTKGGDVVFTKRVKHPGTKPRNVFKRAKEFAIKQIDKLVREAINKRRR